LKMKPAANSVFRIRNGIDGLDSPWLTALREAEFYINRSKRCAIVYIKRAAVEIEINYAFSEASLDLTAPIRGSQLACCLSNLPIL
jgi:hypothetical protein